MRIFCPKCASSEIDDLPKGGHKCLNCGLGFYAKYALIKFADAIIVARGLTHPIRRSILLQFRHNDELSANELSKQLNIELNKVHYHLKVLKECKIVTHTRERKVRGATEHFFRVNLHLLGAN